MTDASENSGGDTHTFSWSRKEIIAVPEQSVIACYTTADDEVCIRQDRWPDEEDATVIVHLCNVPLLMRAILDESGLSLQQVFPELRQQAEGNHIGMANPCHGDAIPHAMEDSKGDQPSDGKGEARPKDRTPAQLRLGAVDG